MALLKLSQVRTGQKVRFFTYAEEQSVTGTVTAKHKGYHPYGYKDVILESNAGDTWCFGTGGHLGDTWTTDAGTQEWFCEEAK